MLKSTAQYGGMHLDITRGMRTINEFVTVCHFNNYLITFSLTLLWNLMHVVCIVYAVTWITQHPVSNRSAAVYQWFYVELSETFYFT